MYRIGIDVAFTIYDTSNESLVLLIWMVRMHFHSLCVCVFVCVPIQTRDLLA